MIIVGVTAAAHALFGYRVEELRTLTATLEHLGEYCFGSHTFNAVMREGIDDLRVTEVFSAWALRIALLTALFVLLLNFFLGIMGDAFAEAKDKAATGHGVQHDVATLARYRLRRLARKWPSSKRVAKLVGRAARAGLPGPASVVQQQMQPAKPGARAAHAEPETHPRNMRWRTLRTIESWGRPRPAAPPAPVLVAGSSVVTSGDLPALLAAYISSLPPQRQRPVLVALARLDRRDGKLSRFADAALRAGTRDLDAAVTRNAAALRAVVAVRQSLANSNQ